MLLHLIHIHKLMVPIHWSIQTLMIKNKSSYLKKLRIWSFFSVDIFSSFPGIIISQNSLGAISHTLCVCNCIHISYVFLLYLLYIRLPSITKWKQMKFDLIGKKNSSIKRFFVFVFVLVFCFCVFSYYALLATRVVLLEKRGHNKMAASILVLVNWETISGLITRNRTNY